MARRAKALVLDTWAILAYLEDEPAGEQVSNLIADAHENEIPLYMNVVNACEVWYILAREVSESAADESVAELRQMGIQFIEADWNLSKGAAEFKAKHKMSLGDCFAAACAKALKADLVTGDTEFRQIDGHVKVLWL